MFVDDENLQRFTGRKRPSDQARFLAERGITFTRRADGKIALRCKELDAYTLSAEAKGQPKRPSWQPDFSRMGKDMLG